MRTIQPLKVRDVREMTAKLIDGTVVYSPSSTPMTVARPAESLLAGIEFTPLVPQVGDIIVKEGFVDLLSVNEYGYVPERGTDATAIANNQLKLSTYCLAQISTSATQSTALQEFRILYSGAKGEMLATSMAVVAALKDALVHRTKVRVHGEARQVVVMVRGVQKSDIYLAVQAVELLRT